MRVRWACILAFVVVMGAASAQEPQAQEPVLLRWKVPAGKVVGFEMDMSPVDPDKGRVIKLDLAGLVEKGELSDELKKAISALEPPAEASTATLLRALPGGNLSVRMILKKVVLPKGADVEGDKGLANELKKMEGTVQLRGEITPSGEVSSFYLQASQRNLLAMFFELPEKPVRPGDAWPLRVNFIQMGPEFTCEKASRTNRVRLVSLTPTPDGDTLATMEYCIVESAKGKVKGPRMDKAQPLAMDMAFVGRGEFLVGKGAWKRLVGRMQMTGAGIMTADVQQNLAAKPMDTVSKDLLKLE